MDMLVHTPPTIGLETPCTVRLSDAGLVLGRWDGNGIGPL